MRRSRAWQFAVGTWSTPGWVLHYRAENHIPHFAEDLPPGNRFLILEIMVQYGRKARAMPVDQSFRGDHHHCLFPIGPEPAGHPEEPVEDGQSGPPVSRLEYNELLAKCEHRRFAIAGIHSNLNKGWGTKASGI